MTLHSFRLFAPFQVALDVQIFSKADAIHSDANIADALKTESIASLKQVHGNRTIIVREPQRRTEEADGMWTDAKDLTLTIRVADCQAFVAYDPKKNVIGLLHAGWKGLVNGAIPAFFKKGTEEFGINAADILIGVGPCLCTQCAEFSDPARELPGIDPRFFHGRNADLRAIADQQLIDAGVLQKNVERIPDCTKCKNGKWWSYRGGDRGKVMEGLTNVVSVTLLLVDPLLVTR